MKYDRQIVCMRVGVGVGSGVVGRVEWRWGGVATAELQGNVSDDGCGIFYVKWIQDLSLCSLYGATNWLGVRVDAYNW